MLPSLTNTEAVGGIGCPAQFASFSLDATESFEAGADPEISIVDTLRHRERPPMGRPRLYLAAIERLFSGRPDEARFPRLYPAKAAPRAGGAMGIVLDAANGSAGKSLLPGRIGFCATSEYVVRECSTFSRRENEAPSPSSGVPAADKAAREAARQVISACTESTQLCGARKGR